VNTPEDPPSIGELIPIVEVERQTGIRQATLRMWESRYGFPKPLRDRHGNRVYPLGQVERLQTVRRLIDQGLRPGKIFSGQGGFEAAGADSRVDVRAAIPARFHHVFELLRAYRLAELHGLVQRQLLDLGLRRFVIDFLVPLSTEIDLARQRGELPLRFEHLFVQLATASLHTKQAQVRAAGAGRPTVLLATLSGETQMLGILMLEAIMASLGMHCIQLGANVPLPELGAAAMESDADIVALCFSAGFPNRNLHRMTAELRSMLPASVALWVGGEGARAAPALVPGAETLDTPEAVEVALRRWLLAHPFARLPFARLP
jgi:methylmalonyl-CoA mutase cobalamin-binding subunit